MKSKQRDTVSSKQCSSPNSNKKYSHTNQAISSHSVKKLKSVSNHDDTKVTQNLSTVFKNFVEKHQRKQGEAIIGSTPLKSQNKKKSLQLDERIKAKIELEYQILKKLQKNKEQIKKNNNNQFDQSVKKRKLISQQHIEVNHIKNSKVLMPHKNIETLQKQHHPYGHQLIFQDAILKDIEMMRSKFEMQIQSFQTRIQQNQQRINKVLDNLSLITSSLNSFKIKIKQNKVLKQLNNQLELKIEYLEKQVRNNQQNKELEYLKDMIKQLKQKNRINKSPEEYSSNKIEIEKKVLINQNFELKKQIDDLQMQIITLHKVLEKYKIPLTQFIPISNSYEKKKQTPKTPQKRETFQHAKRFSESNLMAIEFSKQRIITPISNNKIDPKIEIHEVSDYQSSKNNLQLKR